ncbi:hypothetical protein DEJ50_13055 [Streptomyces venezuelae]|uniref:Lipoprotein n=1 Tax=Streptomyces venezuelae TaxID=54571 RepID=A0A5P2D0F3_STRVZ|nr:hypothetical protein [Streptomyces venezuelae]QES48612.1 hypothetical protein DEJ50_13055 [Streptomyces venezuelae]
MSHASKFTRTAVVGAGVALALVTLGACSDTESDAGKAAEKSSAKPAASAAGSPGNSPAASGKPAEQEQEQKKKAAFKGDGTFEVGKDFQPGTYRTTGNSGTGCYWELAKDSSGELDSIIANDNVTGSSYVTVKAPAKLLKTNGCKDWEAVDAKPSGTPKTEIKGDGGMVRVGADIAPGTYKSAGPAEGSLGCYWERAKNAEHGLESIAANDNPTGSAVVTISPKDGYFKTTGCADWKKTG